MASKQPRRSGAVLVENAVVSSVFGLFMAGIMEFGHAYMVQGAMNAAANRAARYGAVDGVTSAQTTTFAKTLLGAAFKSANATVTVKDASVFDTTTVAPGTINYDTLPNLELSTADKHQLYVVRVTVPYNSVALLPPFWVKNLTLKSQAVMRHE
ncbi:TadE/TadG family type IV pilus assembly protein [Planctomicrobium piriforme]|uniref:Flp pilus assembly protein TadG n=1 Tax=Planctomicrobium piriforme TaxID=1576369 RepID=A0A1I3QAJ9_9PLAN|nr:TadE/TadG family type IV pilus assembly protein [Planctomicrobium piriforme]SFJ31294.1 Flp pilus assembly protein TadG [Planctomicrobium piriforme]